jgi:hypothetical protein
MDPCISLLSPVLSVFSAKGLDSQRVLLAPDLKGSSAESSGRSAKGSAIVRVERRIVSYQRIIRILLIVAYCVIVDDGGA